MPELPEVETIRRGLVLQIKNKKIIDVWIEPSFKTKISPNAREFLAVLKDKKIIDIKRRAKLMIFQITKELFVLIHLKMTGQLVYRKSGGRTTSGGHPIENISLPNKFTRVIFTFADKTHLFFNDIRKFGYLKLVDSAQLQKELSKYGPEPLENNFNLDYFKKMLIAGKKRKIKTLLLDQGLIAGLGNIYSDEVCFGAGVKPMRKVSRLNLADKDKIYWQIKSILKKALKHHGTSVNTYVVSDGKQGQFQNYLNVYGRAGEKCLKCHRGLIMRVKFNGRSSCYCPVCQK
ncbi:MAG: bifunctional DNA-formamidopyrimidine glycosylase/DNA-(apurinic or apyrimidinic site) lyase [Patescibacteria group bacterium]